jgi:hypothetical protein
VLVNALADASGGRLDIGIPVLTLGRVWALLRQAGIAPAPPAIAAA